MKIVVKTLKGTAFDIEVDPTDTVVDVKRNIERAQGTNIYPACQQMLIHHGKVLKDDTTLQENTVVENSFVVVMLTKNKASPSETSKTSAAPPTKVTHTSDPTPAITAPPPQTPIVAAEPQRPTVASPAAVATTPAAPAPLPPAPTSTVPSADAYGEAASHLVAGTDLEGAVQQILDMGGGTWDRAIVIRALRAAFNNPERAVEYLYSGIPEQTEVPSEARQPSPAAQVLPPNPPPQAATQPPPEATPAVPTNQPNSNPLDLFPQGLPTIGSNTATGGAGTLDFLRSSHQFRALQAMVQSNPQILQPMLQELGRQNPQLMRLIQEHQSDFLQLINEPSPENRGNSMDQIAAINVTREEHEAIERLEQMGFERSTVVEVFFACNKDEEMAANYLLDHINEFEE